MEEVADFQRRDRIVGTAGVTRPVSPREAATPADSLRPAPGPADTTAHTAFPQPTRSLMPHSSARASTRAFDPHTIGGCATALSRSSTSCPSPPGVSSLSKLTTLVP